jgi:hypothetical protein
MKRTHFKIGDKVTIQPNFFCGKREVRSRIVRTITDLRLTREGWWKATVTGDKEGKLIRGLNISWLQRLDGEKFKRKITPKQHEKMRALFKKGYSIYHIARVFRCWPNTVWTHVYDLSPSRKITPQERNLFTKFSKLSDTDVLKIRKLALNGYGSPQLAKMYGLSQSAVLGIINGKTYRWVQGPTKKEKLNPIDMDRIKRKTDLRPGTKVGTKQSVPRGTLIDLAEKYQVAPCTIRRWFVRGKLKKIETYRKVN